MGQLSTPSESASAGVQKYGVFAGVYVPTLLTILGVIMYLRLGWVVGNAGLLGGVLIVLLAFGITMATGLAMSSFTTNIRIGAGGAYSIISQSLGLEVGGSVGIPLYLAQALAITLYIFGFREGAMFLVPETWMPGVEGYIGEGSAVLHFVLGVVGLELIIDMAAFAAIVGIAYVSAGFAFKIQYVILGIVALSLVSVAIAALSGSMVNELGDIELLGTYPGEPPEFDGASFWVVFAVFFPASTGIMAGLNMSGDLKNPRKAIPLGTMAAIGTALVVYLLLAIWIAGSASPQELQENYLVMVEKAWMGEIFVLAGLLGATFSSGLASMVGAPRILQALGNHNVLPRSEWLSTRRADGEPQNAVLVTAGIAFLALMLRDLNAIAPLITMAFLITYMMINVVVFFEQTLDLVSFRPLFRVPRVVSFLGMVGCLFAMFIVNPVFSLVALGLVMGAYAVMARRSLDAPYGDVRSGMFISIAEWAAKRVWDLPSMQERAWKPNLLVAARDPQELRGSFLFIRDIATPKGSVKLVGINDDEERVEALQGDLARVASDFRRRGVFSSWIVIDNHSLGEGLIAAMQAARGAFPRPNIVFLRMPEDLDGSLDYGRIVQKAEQEDLGSLLYAPHPKAGLGQRQTVNIWVHDRTPDWSISMDIGNLDLSLLLAFKLKRNWDAHLRILMVVKDEQEVEKARQFLEELLTLARMPETEVVLETGSFSDYVERAPQADLNIFGMDEAPQLEMVRKQVEKTGSSCVFVRDSGKESALA